MKFWLSRSDMLCGCWLFEAILYLANDILRLTKEKTIFSLDFNL